MYNTWKCTICGLVDASAEAPEHCPECSARREMFVASDEAPHGIRHNPMQPRDNHGRELLGPSVEGCVGED